MSEILGGNVDRQVTVAAHPRERTDRGNLLELYRAARRAYDEPLTLRAARTLVENVEPEDTVFVATGAGMPPRLPCGEMDGILGTAGLARALALGRGASTIAVGEQRIGRAVKASARAAGVRVADPEVIRAHGPGLAFVELPTDDTDCQEQSMELLDEYHPSAAVAVEKLGPNRHGVIHSAGGEDWSDDHADVAPLFDAASDRSIPTVAVGDRGNELGFGRIVDRVAELQTYGADCRCGCGGGMASVTEVDALVVATVSNLGAYGIQACMGALTERPELLHTPDEWESMYDAAIQGGAVDGPTGFGMGYDDGIPPEFHRGVLGVLRGILRQELRTADDRFRWA